ncbi:hypothetical protein NE237_006749 [Protea cynaroides]|uniref:Uncharacterized protein n=1 Tax=Protea cynaroides TaxID=273540 RepID=A0A9Q0QVS3_9MAGN|nr:hypothetical protein NE237_006749 [Protea cynaroides]
MMDHGSLTATAGILVLPQEQEHEQDSAPSRLSQHISFLEEEKEDSMKPRKRGRPRKMILQSQPQPQPQPQEEEPMMKPRKRGRPGKMISQSNVQPQDEPMKPRKRGRPRKTISQPVSSSLVQPQQDYQNNEAANRKEEKNSDSMIHIRVAPDPEATDSSTDEVGNNEKRRVIPENGGLLIRTQLQLQLQLQLHDPYYYSCYSSENRKKKKMDRGGVVDLLLPEIPRRGRSRRGTTQRVAYASNRHPLSSSDFQERFATTVHNTTVQSSPFTSELEVPGPIPDFRDLFTEDMDFLFRDFFQDLPSD